MDEIPEAIRVRESNKKPTRSPLPLIIGGALCLAAIGLLSIFLTSSFSKQPRATVDNPSKTVKETDNKADNGEINPTSSTSTPTTPKVLESPPSAVIPNKDLLGHLPYEEVPESNLEPITADGSIRLHSKAAAKFKQMQAAALAQGISLTPISGFRSVESQEQLFFKIKEERVQDAAKRAKVSAPPGYSEHHTGYAIDIGDGNVPEANVETEFENTAAFRWLQANAAKFSFELSFPLNNSQGISYEPWHWRYVGDRRSLETFYKVRNFN